MYAPIENGRASPRSPSCVGDDADTGEQQPCISRSPRSTDFNGASGTGREAMLRSITVAAKAGSRAGSDVRIGLGGGDGDNGATLSVFRAARVLGETTLSSARIPVGLDPPRMVGAEFVLFPP